MDAAVFRQSVLLQPESGAQRDADKKYNGQVTSVLSQTADTREFRTAGAATVLADRATHSGPYFRVRGSAGAFSFFIEDVVVGHVDALRRPLGAIGPVGSRNCHAMRSHSAILP